MKTYRIKDWNRVFENHESRKLKTLSYVSWPARSNSESFARLMRTAEGVAAFGIFSALVSEAAKMPVRGVLADDKGALTPERLAIRIGAPEPIIAAALELLASEAIGWLRETDDENESETGCNLNAEQEPESREPPAISRASPAISRPPGKSGGRPILSSPLLSGSNEQKSLPKQKQQAEPPEPVPRPAPAQSPAAAPNFSEGDVCSLLLALKCGGIPVFDPKGAAAIARSPHATHAKVAWAIERFREECGTQSGRERIRNKAGYVRRLIEEHEPPAGWIERFNRRLLANLAKQANATFAEQDAKARTEAA